MPPLRRLDPDRVAEHLPRLYRAARAWTRSREEAEDLVQETYARVLARPRRLRNADELGYLLRTSQFTDKCSAYADARSLRDNPSLIRDCASWLGPTQPGITTPAPPGTGGPQPAGRNGPLLDYLLRP